MAKKAAKKGKADKAKKGKSTAPKKSKSPAKKKPTTTSTINVYQTTIELEGSVVEVTGDVVVFKYRKPRHKKRVSITVPMKDLVMLYNAESEEGAAVLVARTPRVLRESFTATEVQYLASGLAKVTDEEGVVSLLNLADVEIISEDDEEEDDAPKGKKGSKKDKKSSKKPRDDDEEEEEEEEEDEDEEEEEDEDGEEEDEDEEEEDEDEDEDGELED